jgi:hypothetical protein
LTAKEIITSNEVTKWLRHEMINHFDYNKSKIYYNPLQEMTSNEVMKW